MRDPRLDKLAAVLVQYSTHVKKGDLVRIAGEVAGLPLMEALQEEVLRAGGHPFFTMTSDNMDDAFFRLASDEQLSYVSPVSQFVVEKMDVSIGIWADENTRSRTNVPPEKQTLASKARQPFVKRLLERAAKKECRWVGTQYPTTGSAQDAEMSLYEYCDFVFRAGLLHLPDPVAGWRAMSERQQRLADFLEKKREIRVIAPGTDLRVGVEGRHWINCDGHENFPDGEVFTGPIETATEGTIHYTFPAVYQGREVLEIELLFKAGRVVDARAAKGQDFLLKMIDQDAGGRTFGEFAIGTNFGVKQFSRNILFDEKIGGTCHAALGKAYPESGGTNDSALHWDMICDLRQPGCEIQADGEVILREGKFTRPEWPSA
jgi:aminopeptidase